MEYPLFSPVFLLYDLGIGAKGSWVAQSRLDLAKTWNLFGSPESETEGDPTPTPSATPYVAAIVDGQSQDRSTLQFLDCSKAEAQASLPMIEMAGPYEIEFALRTS